MEAIAIKALRSNIQDVDEKGIVVVAANAFGNEDAHKDISERGSYSKTIQERFNRLKWYKNHNQSELLGVPIEASETEKYLVVKGQLNMNKQIGRDIYEDYKMHADMGRSLEHSVGVRAMKRDEKDKRRVLEWKWFEYSTLTNWGANPDTPMLSIKSDTGLIEQIDFLTECIRKGNYSDTYGKQIEQQIVQLKALIANGEPSADTHKKDKPQLDILHLKTLKFA